jgi:histidinol-phosphate/aromatic aminotransferase/cobyric acid decarboxylase-like protein/imidazoleglycerol phosphate dehydratase HisB
MSAAPQALQAYVWPPSTETIADRFGLDPTQVIRFDGNTPASPSAYARPAIVARALAQINEYDRGRYPQLREAIARRHGVEPGNILLSAGSDDLILLTARTFASRGTIATVPSRTYSMYGFAAGMADAALVADPATADLTFVCRPNNPTGEMPALPLSGRLVVDEAYADYAGESVIDRIGEGLIVLRTFSKAFGLAGARVGYALASADNVDILSSRQAPLTIAAPSAALALAALASPPDVRPQIEERERLAAELARMGVPPLRSFTNFVFVALSDPSAVADALLPFGIVVRSFEDGIRISVRDREDDDLLLAALASVLEVSPPTSPATGALRHVRATAETCIRVRMRLCGEGRVYINTGSGFYDHMLQQLAFHSGMDLFLEGTGDLEIGEHHTVEDTMRAFGEALDKALGSRRGMARYGEARIPMDEAMAHAVVDLSGRPVTRLTIAPDPGLACHALESLSQTARITLHVNAAGDNAHHVAEAAFKAVGRALAAAMRVDGTTVKSTKGTL